MACTAGDPVTRWHSSAADKAKPFALSSTGGLIGGAFVGAASGQTLDVINPATGAAFARVADMGAEDTVAAVAAAKAALPAWAARSPYERSALLRKLHDAMGAHAGGLAALLTLECGKPLPEAAGEIAYGQSFLDWFAEEGKRHYGEVIPPPRADRRLVTMRQPVGVAALLTPWNFSSAMVARKLAPALAAGCTVVLRPSAETPLSAMAIAQLATEVGFPKGVVNLVVGHDHAALAGTLCAHPDVAKVSFTGSTRVGKLLMAACAPGLKRMSLELGGDAPFIVFEDADIPAAVEGAIASKFRNAGQTCVCANRIYVHDAVYERFREHFVAKVSGARVPACLCVCAHASSVCVRMLVRACAFCVTTPHPHYHTPFLTTVSQTRALVVGDGFTAGVSVGPVISRSARDKAERIVAEAVAGGAVVLAGGARVDVPGAGSGGFFYAPTVLEGLPPGCAAATEELFAPIAPLQRFRDEADVIARANATSVGLAGYFYTK